MTEITVSNDLPPAIRRFVLQWGDMGGQWGVNRSVSQIHALLYLAEKPLTAEDIAETLAMARSNVSNSLKELQGWGLVRRVPVLGDRRDHFEADTDIWSIAAKIAAGRKERELDPAIAALEACVAEGGRRCQAVGDRGGAAERDARFHPHHDGLVRPDEQGAEADLDGADPPRRTDRGLPAGQENEIGEGDMARLNVLERIPTPAPSPSLGDLRFRALLAPEAWAALPAPVRARFSKRLTGGDSAVYAGEVTQTRVTRAGRLFAQAARLIGGPLPLFDETGIPAIVTVTEDAASGGQVWTRLYARRSGFPQVIHSAKRFAGDTGLEEYVGRGVGMALTVHVEDGVLLFRSAGYFVQLGGARLGLPAFLVPGALTVMHKELGEGRFLFALDIVHPLFGPIIHQTAIFREAIP